MNVSAKSLTVGICDADGKLYFLATKIVRSRIRRDLRSRRETLRFPTEIMLAMSASERFIPETIGDFHDAAVGVVPSNLLHLRDRGTWSKKVAWTISKKKAKIPLEPYLTS